MSRRPNLHSGVSRAALFTYLLIAGLLASIEPLANPAQAQQISGQSGSTIPKVSIPPTPKPDSKKAKQASERGVAAEKSGNWQEAYDAYSDAAELDPNDREYFLRREVAKSRLVQSKMDLAERDAVSGRIAKARQDLLDARYLDPTNPF